MRSFTQNICPSHIRVVIISLVCLAQTTSCTPMPGEGDQLPALDIQDGEQVEHRVSPLEDIIAKLQFAREDNVVTILSMFGQLNGMSQLNGAGQLDGDRQLGLYGVSPLNGMLGKSLINIVIDQAKQTLVTRFANLNISTQCQEDFTATVTALLASEMWGLKIADAAGKLGSGVLEGNIYWFGSYDECLSIRPTMVDKNNNTITPFNTHFVVTYIPLLPQKGMVILSLQWGSCVPDSCAASDVTEVVKEALSIVNVDTKGVYSSLKPETFPLDGPAIGMITFFCVLLMVLTIATGYDVIIYQPMLAEEQEQLGAKVIECSDSGLPTPIENGILRVDEDTPLLIVTRKLKEPVNTADIHPVAKVLVKISIFSNAKKILHTGKSSASVLGAVHGVRLASMSWVILGHTFFYCLQNSQNLGSVVDLVKLPAFQALINATVSVDTFFLISGLLVSYLVLNEMREKGGPWKINWVLFYFHRIWRLTPAYMVVLAAYTTLYRYLGNGPMWPGDVPEVHCKDNWWTNLLYINNIYKSGSGCMMWSWYLSNDMQFYMISPIILIPLYLHFGAGLFVTLALMLISFICTGVISAQNGYPPSSPAMLYYLDKLASYFQYLYLVPWTRIGPYLIGILVGYALYRTERKVTLKWYTVAICWLVAAGCNLLILYGLYDVSNGAPISNDVSALYNAVHRTMWACGVGWVIFACVTGYGGPVNTILSWPALIPLSRLTYMAYLLHPIVIQRFYNAARIPIYLDINNAVYLFLAHFAITYGLAFVLSLAIESPTIGLEKFIFKR